MAAVRVAFAARGNARLAADAAVRVDEELHVHDGTPRNQKAETRNQKGFTGLTTVMSGPPFLVSDFWFLVSGFTSGF
jgi:hypothetical protein